MEEDDPPAPPRLRDPPALPDELVEEVLLRSPPDDPAHLVRAALICKCWFRLVSDLAFRRRFRDFHLQRRGAPMLGFLHSERGLVSSCFVRTSASCAPLNTPRVWLALDARGGRVLLQRANEHAGRDPFDRTFSMGICLAVWEPLPAGGGGGGGHLELPVLLLPRRPFCWTVALLCDQHGLLDHADGRFRVFLVGTDTRGTFACVYSSLVPAAWRWSEAAYRAQHPGAGVAGGGCVDAVRGVLVGNVLYFSFQVRTRILKYDLATDDMSVVRLPRASYSGRMLRTVLTLTTTKDGGLGFARVEGYNYKLCLWSMEARPNGGALEMEWTLSRVIDLRSLLPDIELLGFVDGVGMILVGTNDGFFSVQKSGRIDKLVDGCGFYRDVVPYVSFYTPALGTTSIDGGLSANA